MRRREILNPKSQIPNVAGFSLVEVLVALAITALVSVTIIGSVSGMTSHLTNYRDDTQLALLIEALAHDISIRGLPKNLTGSFDTHPDYTWSIQSAPMMEGNRETTFKELILTVTAPSGRTFSANMLL